VLHKWVAENGEYDIFIGSSSQDIRLSANIDYKGAEPYSLVHMSEAKIGGK